MLDISKLDETEEMNLLNSLMDNIGFENFVNQLEDDDVEFIIDKCSQDKLCRVISNWLNNQSELTIISVLQGLNKSNRVLIRNYLRS